MEGLILRGAVLWQNGDTQLEVRDDFTLIRRPGPGEVRVSISATGLCRTDLSPMSGGFPAPVPAILGHEAAGVVEEVGSGIRHVNEGDHVIVSFIPLCGRCGFCLNGQASLCKSVLDTKRVAPTHMIGDVEVRPFGNVGSFVEQTILPVESVVVVPVDLPADLASLIGCCAMTGVGAAINAAKVEPGSSVVVFGCGGIGLNIIQGARIAGAAEIVAVDSQENKFALARKLGATHTVTPERLPEVRDEINAGEGFDFGFEAVGKSAAISAAFRAVRRGGTVVVAGAGAPTEKVDLSAFELFFGQKRLVGTVYGSADVRRDFPKLIRLWRTGRLELESLISHRFDISEINTAVSRLNAGEGIRQVMTF